MENDLVEEAGENKGFVVVRSQGNKIWSYNQNVTGYHLID